MQTLAFAFNTSMQTHHKAFVLRNFQVHLTSCHQTRSPFQRNSVFSVQHKCMFFFSVSGIMGCQCVSPHCSNTTDI